MKSIIFLVLICVQFNIAFGDLFILMSGFIDYGKYEDFAFELIAGKWKIAVIFHYYNPLINIKKTFRFIHSPLNIYLRIQNIFLKYLSTDHQIQQKLKKCYFH